MDLGKTCSYFVLLVNYTRILITGGRGGDELVEIIDLLDQNLVCEPLADFPADIYSAGEKHERHSSIRQLTPDL